MNYSSGVNNRLSKKNVERMSQNEGGGANKRKRPANYAAKSPAKKNVKSEVAVVASTPFDSILNEIEAFDSGNRKRDANRAKNELKSDEGSGPCSSKQQPPLTPIPNAAIRPLTKAELLRGEEDTTILRSILNKDGLMERILGYKMIRGRVESCSTIRNLIDLDNCVSPEYEDVSDLRDPERRHPAVPFHNAPLTASVHQSHTPPGAPIRTPASSDKHSGIARSVAAGESSGEPRRGPKTPPGSPPPLNRSRSASIATSGGSSSPNRQHRPPSDDSGRARRTRCTALPPPPVFPAIDGTNSRTNGKTEPPENGNGDDSETLLRQFSEVTHTPVSQLREFIGEDLQAAMSRIDRSVLLSTLKNALKTVATDKPSSAGPHSGQPQSVGDGCEMEISSEYSIGRPSGEGSSQLLPPPPPPVISPPPPPPPLLDAGGQRSPTPPLTMPTVNLCVPPPQFPPPPLRGSTPAGGTVNLVQPLPLPISASPFAPTVPPPHFGASATAAPSPSGGVFVVPPPILSAAAGGREASSPPTVIRVDLTQQNRPIKHHTQNIPGGISVQSTQKTVVNLSAKLKGKGPTSSISTPQRPARQRPAPTVNMDFIKSRPPPPIPEILRKNIVSNESAVGPPPPVPLIQPSTAIGAPPPGVIDVSTSVQPTPLFKVVAPPTVPPMDLTKLVGVSAPLVAQPPPVPIADATLFMPSVPPPGFNNKTGEAKSSRPTSRMSGGALPVGAADVRPVNTPPPKIVRNALPPPLIGAESMPTTSRGPPPSFHVGAYKQPLLPSPGRSGGGGEPRRSSSNNDGNIFKSLMSALSTTAAAAALAQALPQYTNSSPAAVNVRDRGAPAQPSGGQSGQPLPGADAILPNVMSSASGGAPSNSAAASQKFNFANMREQDLNASIATFVRALTSGAAAVAAAKNPVNTSNNGGGPPSRNRPYPPPPPR